MKVIAGVTAALLIECGAAYGYRPFISTDAAVADPHQVEVEMGYFGFSRTSRANTYGVPQLVLNYGVHDRMEAVAELNQLDIPDRGSPEVMAPALDLKWVAREGFLQDKPGDSVAFETTLLLPSTLPGQKNVGFQETGIWSHRLLGLLFHFNLGGGVTNDDAAGFLFWGTIAEKPITRTLRAVGEITGESPADGPPDNSGLVGLIWDTPKPNLALDVGVRRGLSQSSADWQLTAGFSYGFVPPQLLESLRE
jgi:hypothetical protein